MKAISEQTYLRAAETGSTMALPQQSQEIVDKAAKLEEDIKNLEKIGGTEILAIAEKKKLELNTLQPKLPLLTQPLKDHENVVSALRELEEKGNGEIKELEDKKKDSEKRSNKSKPTR